MTLTLGTTCSNSTVSYVNINGFNDRANLRLCNGEEAAATFAVRNGIVEGSLTIVASPALNGTTLICYSEDAATSSNSSASMVISVVGEQSFEEEGGE